MPRVNLRTLTGAFLTWLIPLIASFGLYDPATGSYVPGFLGFKIIMAVLAGASTFFTYRWITRQHTLAWSTAGFYLIVNSLLDVVVLILMFRMPPTEWLTTILPLYLLVFFGILAIMRGKT